MIRTDRYFVIVYHDFMVFTIPKFSQFYVSLFYTSIYGVSQANMIKLSRCRTSSRKEAVFIDYINTFLVSVAASIVGCYVCKWLDRDNRQ